MHAVADDATYRNRVYRQLRRAIIMGRRGPGERLSVEELCQIYGSGISPVRDALQMLGQEGLIEIKPRSGYFVASVTLKELRDLLDMREVLEIAAVERATPRITERQLAELENVHAGYTGDDDESYDRYTDENRRFHYLLGQASGNVELAESLGRLHDRLARFIVMRHAGGTQHQTHARIVAGLRARDAESARQAMLDEINESRQAILDRVMQGEGAGWQITALK
jgi:GntR family transcriptional regulator, rspAB operon transcriptional repressor